MIQSLNKYFDGVRALQFFQICRQGGLLLAAVILAKSSIGQNAIGEYETLFLVSGALSFFWVGAWMNTLVSRYPKIEESKRPAAITGNFIVLVLVNICLLALLISLSTFFQKELRFDDPTNFKWLILFIFLNNPSYLIEHMLLLQKRYLTLSCYGVIVLAGTLLAVGIPLLNGGSLEQIFQGLVIFAAIKFFTTCVLVIRSGKLQFDPAQLKAQWWVALPLGISLLLGGTGEYIDGFIVKHYFDNVQFSIYRYGAKELPIVLLMANAFSVAMIPVLSENLNEGLSAIKKRSARLMHILYPVTILLLLTSSWLFPVVFNSDFADSAIIFNIYLLLIISRLIFPQTILIALQKTQIMAMISFLEIMINVGLSLTFLLAMDWGIQGIAMATVIAFLFEKIALMIYLQFKIKISPGTFIPTSQYLFWSAVLLATFLFVNSSDLLAK